MAAKILFVGHDANRAGAQLVLLHWLKENAANGQKGFLLLEKGGDLLATYRKYAEVWVWRREHSKSRNFFKKIPFLKREESSPDREPNKAEIQTMLREFRQQKFDLILGNTVASLSLMQQLSPLKIAFGAYVHELKFSCETYASEKDMQFLAQKVKKVYAVSEQVSLLLKDKYEISEDKLALLPPVAELAKAKSSTTEQVREHLNIPASSPIVLGCGLAEWRKGTDVFIRVARQVIRLRPDVHFIWLGMGDNLYSAELMEEKEKWDVSAQVHLIPAKADTKAYFEAMDLFFLSSREDPFPLVMLEAGYQAKPVLGFKESGGIADFTRGLEGLLVDYLDEGQMTELIIHWLDSPAANREKIGEELQLRSTQYTVEAFMARWAELEKEL
ncbi:glycosyltransferase [Aquirufa rosea]|uniref:Glycosyltransferase n=1 Tax=Aquirufa rosea TaxID=2509241 RepID=A0A4Q1C0S7_9BACT|nr:glycosyltransferase [Aquirufa rosea]RXK50735.1 glycosyltransferase [Aquirufa rosea]